MELNEDNVNLLKPGRGILKNLLFSALYVNLEYIDIVNGELRQKGLDCYASNVLGLVGRIAVVRKNPKSPLSSSRVV